MAPKIVVDTSVLIKWFKTRGEEFLKEAARLREEIDRGGIEVHVPALLLYEVGNILLVKTRLRPAALDEAVARLEALPFVVAPPAAPILKRALRLGRESSLTFYDASFLALAVELDCMFVTADERLIEQTHSHQRGRDLSRIGSII